MKKRIAMLLMTTMVVAMFTGCGQNDEKSDDSAANTTPVSEESSTREFKALFDDDATKYVTLGDYIGVSANYVVEEPTEKDIQEKIGAVLESKAEYKEITGRAVKEGDIVNIDYCGKKDGIAFEGGTAQGYDLEIGSHTFIDGFEDGLIGKKKGEVAELNLTFPETYHTQELAGSAVVFTVSVNSISEKIVPALNDALAAELNPKCKNVNDYKAAVKESIISDNRINAKSLAMEEIYNTVVANATINEVPQWLIDEKLDFTKTYFNSMIQYYGVSKEDFLAQQGMTEETFEQQCLTGSQADAKNHLVIYAIAKKEGLLLTKDEMEKELAPYMQYAGLESVDAYIKTSEGIENAYYVQTNKVLEFLFEKAKID